MTALAPKEIKYVDRLNTLLDIMKTGKFLYEINSATKYEVLTQEDVKNGASEELQAGLATNNKIIKILTNAKNKDLTQGVPELRGLSVYFKNKNTQGKLKNLPFSKIEKDERFIDINLGHVFELIFCIGLVAAIKKRPTPTGNCEDYTMPPVDEEDITSCIEDLLKKKGELTYTAMGCQEELDTIQLSCPPTSLSFRGLNKLWNNQQDWEKVKNKLIPPVLTYVKLKNTHNLRLRLFTNGIVDNYNVTLIGSKQEKQDVEVTITSEDKKIENITGKISQISLKLNSRTFGSVKGNDAPSLVKLFKNFSLNIGTLGRIGDVPRVKEAYTKAKQDFDKKTSEEQLKIIQNALNTFYSGSSTGTENFSVIKFQAGNVYSRDFQNFSENYIKMFGKPAGLPKIKTTIEPSRAFTNTGKLIFSFPDSTKFLTIRFRISGGKYRHEIEEQAGMKKIIGRDLTKEPG
jgi:hypothetical protein